jgi:uncharacterized protein
MTPEPVSTPCVNVCAVDGRTGLCAGCGRTLKEIAEWGRLDEAARKKVMAELPARRAAAACGAL